LRFKYFLALTAHKLQHCSWLRGQLSSKHSWSIRIERIDITTTNIVFCERTHVWFKVANCRFWMADERPGDAKKRYDGVVCLRLACNMWLNTWFYCFHPTTLCHACSITSNWGDKQTGISQNM